MTLATARYLWRRLMTEQVAVNWSDSDALTYINLAYMLVQNQVKKVDPEALIQWDYADLVGNTKWYKVPLSTYGPSEVAILDPQSSAMDPYNAIEFRPFNLARQWDNTVSGITSMSTVWSKRGRWIGIHPTPQASLTQGLRFQHAGIDQVAVDTDTFLLLEPAAYAVVLWAAKLARGETPEDPQNIAGQLQAIIGDLPNWYSRNLAMPEFISPDFQIAALR